VARWAGNDVVFHDGRAVSVDSSARRRLSAFTTACDRPRMSHALVLALLLTAFLSTLAAAEGDFKAGWTKKLLDSETEDCTEATVKAAWENTKRDQGVDPSLPLTPDVRKKLAPQIAAMKKLCACAIRAAAKRYTRAEAEATPSDLQQFIADTVANGTCKLEPPRSAS